MSYTYLFVIFDIMFQRMGQPDLWPLKVTHTSDLQHWHERMGSAHSACQLEAESVGNVAKLSQVWWDDDMMIPIMIWCFMMRWCYDVVWGRGRYDEVMRAVTNQRNVTSGSDHQMFACLHGSLHCTGSGSPAATVSSCSLSKFLLSFVEVLGDCLLNQCY